MSLRKSQWLFLGVFILASFLRLWHLGRIPEGFYSDEALYGYEAYSVSMTGRDQFGNFLPLSFAGFGDFRPGLYIYFTTIFVTLFGLTEFATRLPSALTSISTVIIVYFIAKKLTSSKKIALLCMLTLAISPWHVFFGRMAHETNLMTFLLVGGIYFLSNYHKYLWGRTLAILMLGSSLYVYHSARIFVPLFLIFSAILFRVQLKKPNRITLYSYLLGFVTILPLCFELFSGSGWARVKGISIWTDPGLIPKVNETRGKLLNNGMPPLLARIVVNKGTVLTGEFIKNYTSHFRPTFLLTEGDPNDIYNTPQNGILYWIEVPLFFIGTAILLSKKLKLGVWLIGTLLLTLVPDALTRVAPSSARIHLAAPFVSIMIGIGWSVLSKNRWLKAAAIVCVCLNLWWFWNSYLFVRPVQHERAWQIGAKEMIYKVNMLAPRYEKIWISRSGWGWIHLVFHTKYDPQLLQKQIVPSVPNELGFWWVADVGKYHLDDVPSSLDFSQNTLYVGMPQEFMQKVTPFAVVKNSQNKDVYWIVDKTSLRE